MGKHPGWKRVTWKGELWGTGAGSALAELPRDWKTQGD